MGRSTTSQHVLDMLTTMAHSHHLLTVAHRSTQTVDATYGSYAIALDAPTTVPPGLGRTQYGYLGDMEGRVALSGHQRMTLAEHEAQARASLAHVQAALDAAPGLSGWFGTLRVARSHNGHFTLWFGPQDAPARLLASHIEMAAASARLAALVRAGMLCDAPRPDSPLWLWNGPQERPHLHFFAGAFPAVSHTDAAILGTAIHQPGKLQALLQGSYYQAEVSCAYDAQITQASVVARYAARQTRATRTHRTPSPIPVEV